MEKREIKKRIQYALQNCKQYATRAKLSKGLFIQKIYKQNQHKNAGKAFLLSKYL